MTRKNFLFRASILCGSLGFLLAGETSARAGLTGCAGRYPEARRSLRRLIFEVSLDPNSSFGPADWFKIFNVVGVGVRPAPRRAWRRDTDYAFLRNASSPSQQGFPSPYDPAHGYPKFITSDVEWKNASGTTFTAGPDSPFYLGEFIVQTTVSVPDFMQPYSITLDYTSSINGTTVKSVTLPLLPIPEPSTMVMVGIAGVMAWVLLPSVGVARSSS